MLPTCFLRFSLKNFIGQSENSYTGATAINVREDPGVVSQGNNFMRKLASTAPSQPLMFQEGILDVGQQGMRHGFVQCRRDLNVSACDKCLNNLLDKYIPQFGDNRAWEFSSFSCSIWYDDVHGTFSDRNLTNETSSTGNTGETKPSLAVGTGRFKFRYTSLLLVMLLAL
ncbi:Gnk2-homologous domain-containing protein [Abeliophyllum distichum]|uniref:Gnk2-homologous domain-containing protein n=1 Tax=Abeliophyllum distichum TaxID=126358 RepID=A0ABD1UG13_9LAMI